MKGVRDMEENKMINGVPEEGRGKSFKIKKENFIKNQGYIMGVTAVIVVAVILLNVLVGSFSDKLKFDFSAGKSNSISEENKEYIKNLEAEVTVTVCADEENYANTASYGMVYYAYNYYGVYGGNDNDYYTQTLNLIDKYGDYSKKIEIKYVDTQSTEFAGIMNSYPNDSLKYGDIIVATESGRYRVVTYEDIYELESDSSGYYTVTGNNIETALTSAIDYVVSGKEVKVAVLTGHSKTDYTDDYIALLQQNNYTVDIIEDKLINSISNEYDAVILAAPTSDFLESEIKAFSEYLSNATTLGKGLVYFADATTPLLPNLAAFLKEWGINEEEGILFETEANYHIEGDPTSMGMYPSGQDDITSNMNYCISGYNVPLSATEAAPDGIKVTTLLTTSPNVVNAPVGTSSDWTGYGDYQKNEYSGVIMAEKTADNTDRSSFVVAFGSIEYIKSQWTQYSALSNQDITVAAAEKAVNAEDNGITFTAKTIKNESFADKVTSSSVLVVDAVFVWLLPLAVIAVGIYVFIKRRNR